MIAINAAMANQLNEFRASVEKLMEEGVGKDEAIFRLLKKPSSLPKPSALKATVTPKNGDRKLPAAD